MANTCIICPNPAGSGEHVFPASMGGRRTNKQIYCKEHDNGYSGLVAELSEQFALFNSLLGVVNDHTKQAKRVSGSHVGSGDEMTIARAATSFSEPRVFSMEQDADRSLLTIMATDTNEGLKWARENAKPGETIELVSKGKRQRYFPGFVHFNPNFGGDEGLAAVGYVAQTFLAQGFPDIARSAAMKGFKDYTQHYAKQASAPKPTPDEGEEKEGAIAHVEPEGYPQPWPVWWDFSEGDDTGETAFKFGHRILIGVDSADGLVYGRMSFFSTLHFAMIFGNVSGEIKSQTIITDIDPLATHRPQDIKVATFEKAVGRVRRSPNERQDLADAISSGRQQAAFHDLVGRLLAYGQELDAQAFHGKMSRQLGAEGVDVAKIFHELADSEAQRILILMTHFVSDFKTSKQGAALKAYWPLMDSAVARDAASLNGLTPASTSALEGAVREMAAYMHSEHDQGLLTVQRVEDLLNTTDGFAVVAMPIMEPIFANSKDL